MTTIDPTPLIAEAQARETALKVALAKIDGMESEVKAWRRSAVVLFALLCLYAVVLA